MPVFKTANNRVVADEPECDDTHVRVVWFGPPQDGLHMKIFHGPALPAEDYDDAVEWARSMADQMVYPLYVVPMTGVEVMRTEQMQRGVANLTDEQRWELRQEMIAMLAKVMRDCDDPVVRADAHEILAQMKVVRP
jgi:hypothetical protein